MAKEENSEITPGAFDGKKRFGNANGRKPKIEAVLRRGSLTMLIADYRVTGNLEKLDWNPGIAGWVEPGAAGSSYVAFRWWGVREDMQMLWLRNSPAALHRC